MYTTQIIDLKGQLNSRECQGTQARPGPATSNYTELKG